MKQFIKATLLLALVIALGAIGTVRAAEQAEMEASQRWRITNPCFNSEGKWFTR